MFFFIPKLLLLLLNDVELWTCTWIYVPLMSHVDTWGHMEKVKNSFSLDVHDLNLDVKELDMLLPYGLLFIWT